MPESTATALHSNSESSKAVAQGLEPRFAEVAVPVPVFQSYTYSLPKDLPSLAQPGARILVPLGNKLVTGYIVGLHNSLNPATGLKELEIKEAAQILDHTPVVTAEVLQITRWVSDYYAAPWGEVIKAALPPGISPKSQRFFSLTAAGRVESENLALTKTPNSKERLLLLLGTGEETSLQELSKTVGKTQATKALRELESEGWVRQIQRSIGSRVKTKQQRTVRPLRRVQEIDSEGGRLTAAQRRVLETLERETDMILPELLRRAEASSVTVKTLQKRNLVEFFDQSVRRDPLAGSELPTIEKLQLTEAQSRVLGEIEKPLRQGIYSAFLLHGVTGSGKTEVYMRAMRVTLELGRSALMLVPEIALTPVFSRRLRAHFGDQVAIFHSALSPGERFDEWSRVRHGESRIVIGTRSAVFAPVSNLGLVIVDEEHESTYRQQESPRYSGRDTAIVRAQKESAVVVLGSATPSLESFHNARIGKYGYLNLPDRIRNRPLARAQIIDMRRLFDRHKRPRVFSDELLEAIKETTARREQSIVLLNRRGYSSFVLCRSCGDTIQCPNCDVTLTYHRAERVLLCHYCDHRQSAPSQCPTCGGKYIYYIGEGTEQIEELLRKLFPALRIARIDRDTTSRRRVFEQLLQEFSEGRLDMLVGTQMLAKGHDYPNVTLVGVVSVDAGLALPDFRAAERTFQLITQVAGRAGRGDRPGQVLIQTYHPDHYALQHSCAQDYLAFYEEEIKHRQNHSYPPFVSLAALLLHGPDLKRLRSQAIELRKELDLANKERDCRLLGPAPAPLARLKGEYRIQLLLKSHSRSRLRGVVDAALNVVLSRGANSRSINLEIDPISIM